MHALRKLSVLGQTRLAVKLSDFENAADEVERKLGLEGQPRAIVFHEKDGRRHAHVVWSRIDAEHMRAINLPHYKMRLRDVSRDLFRAHGWEMPKGLRDWRERDVLKEAHEKRWISETKARAERLPRGFSGIWQRLTGKYSKIKQRNEREAWAALKRDRAERDNLIASQRD